MNGEIVVRRQPEVKVKVVDGSSLAVAIVHNTLPKGTTKITLRGNTNKVACSITLALCQKGIQVTVPCEDDLIKLNVNVSKSELVSSLVLSKSCEQLTIWLVGEGLTDEDQKMASKGTIFILYTQFPPLKLRKDCFYHTTPAMLAPKDLQNIHSCENWLPRRVISTWCIAGILHAFEGWDVNECGNNMFDIDRVWEASLRHGFRQ